MISRRALFAGLAAIPLLRFLEPLIRWLRPVPIIINTRRVAYIGTEAARLFCDPVFPDRVFWYEDGKVIEVGSVEWYEFTGWKLETINWAREGGVSRGLEVERRGPKKQYEGGDQRRS